MNNLLYKFRFRIFALTAILLVSVSSVFAQIDTIAIVDAGSSGSRLYLYAVDKKLKTVTQVNNDVPRIDLKLSENCNQMDIGGYISSLTGENPNKYGIKDLYVLATAGMRYVNKSNANDIYKRMINMESNGYKVISAMTISGKYEGLYAWIASNYDQLKGKNSWKNVEHKGIIEIGGASMQIAFANPSESIDKKDVVKRNDLSIYSKSFLGGGVDMIFDKKKIGDTLTYFNAVKDLPYIANYTFYGLGKPIKIVQEGVIGNNNIGSYIKAIGKEKNQQYHPESNAHYIKWLMGKLKQDINRIDTSKDVSWTKGAAYDIIINNKLPESFNYEVPN